MTTYLLSAAKIYMDSYAGLPRKCWQGIIISFIAAVVMDIYFFLPLHFVSVLHFNVATSGLLMSCYGVGTIAGGFFGGKLSDRISPHIVTASSLLIQSIAFLLLQRLTSVNLLMFNLFMVGLASYGFLTSNYAWVLKHCDDHEPTKIRAMNLLNTASNLGFGISSAIISYFVVSGFTNMMHIASGVLCMLALYAFYFERTVLLVTPKQTIDQSLNESVAPLNKKNSTIIAIILGSVFLMGLIISQLNTTYSIYIHDTFPSYGMQGVGILFMLNAFLVVTLQTPIGDILSGYNKVMLAGIGAFLIGAGMCMLNFSYTFYYALIACVIYTCGEMIFFTFAQYLCYHNASANKKGQGLGLYRMIFASSRVAGPMVGTVIYQTFGGQTVWYLCGLLGVVCIYMCNAYKKFG